MDIGFLLGLVGAGLILFFGVPEVIKDPVAYANVPSMVIVIIGVITATMLSTNISTAKKLAKVFSFMIMPPKKAKPEEIIPQLVEFSKIASSKGKIALQDSIKNQKDPFLIHGLTMIVDNMDADFIKRALLNDIEEMQNRHDKYIGIVKNMGTLAPMFGMMGTIVGLIQVLKNMEDPSAIGPAMAIALLTSLYGATLNGAFFTPFAIKLKEMSDSEALLRNIMTEGMIFIQSQEIPIKVEKYLMGYLSNDQKKKKSK